MNICVRVLASMLLMFPLHPLFFFRRYGRVPAKVVLHSPSIWPIPHIAIGTSCE